MAASAPTGTKPSTTQKKAAPPKAKVVKEASAAKVVKKPRKAKAAKRKTQAPAPRKAPVAEAPPDESGEADWNQDEWTVGVPVKSD